MRVQCDVCKGEQEATVFCCADGAALCGPCNRQVHSANKLAGKHRLLSLLHPASRHQFPLCDICKEKRALLFCQEDRAILCRDCDAPIHDASNLTRKHSRFLLTGIRISPFADVTTAPEASASSCHTPSSVAAPSSTTTTASAAGERALPTVNKSNKRSHHGVLDCASTHYKKPPLAAKGTEAIPVTAAGFCSGNTAVRNVGVCNRTSAAASPSATATAIATGSSSISEYLMKELPGWHVEDLLLNSFPLGQQPAATNDHQMPADYLTPFWGDDLDAAVSGVAFGPESGGWTITAGLVPQVPLSPGSLAPFPPVDDCDRRQHAMAIGVGGQLIHLLSRQSQQYQYHPPQQQRFHSPHHRRTAEDGFTVPALIATHQNPSPPTRGRGHLLCASPPDVLPREATTSE